jgi:hypothetical protein
MKMAGIDFAKESPLKQLAFIRIKRHRKMTGEAMPKSMNGFWQITERFGIDSKGGMARVVRVMTSDSVNEPLGEEFTMPYGMVCSSMEQISISAID